MNAPKIKYEKFYFFIIPKRLAEIGLNGNNKKDTYYRINKKKKVPDSLFARIDAKQFEKMTVLMGPGTNESDCYNALCDFPSLFFVLMRVRKAM